MVTATTTATSRRKSRSPHEVGGARPGAVSVLSVAPSPRATSAARSRVPVTSPGPYCPLRSSGTMASRTPPAAASVTIPSSPFPVLMKMWPELGSPSRRGTTSTTSPALRRASPMSAANPTPQARPMASATSDAA